MIDVCFKMLKTQIQFNSCVFVKTNNFKKKESSSSKMTTKVSWLIIFICILPSFFSLSSKSNEINARDPHPIVSVQPRHVHLAIAEDNKDLSVSWSTINKTEESVVLVYSKGRELKFVGQSVKFVDGGKKRATQWIHKVLVSGLPPNTTYRYRVGSDMGWSDVFSMKTLPSGITYHL